jgi:2,4-dienoyl-CoA reductase-like NADH-dependent reductase (Old Yellow Enzyme family)
LLKGAARRANSSTDCTGDGRWGGSLENRARFLLAVVDAVRARVGDDFAVSVKLNSADFQKGGFTLDECLRVVGWLGERKVDLLEISGGTYENLIFMNPGYHDRGAG